MLNGVICINKEENMTSHDVCFKVRKILGTRKVGHSGTLDPMATGVMGILVGRSTKLCDYITSSKKEYIASVEFGKSSLSYDIWTDIIKEETPSFNRNDLNKAIISHTGNIIQTPPIYSAIKVKGKPLYKYAISGEEVEIPSREVFIESIEVIEENIPYSIKIKVSCSKGTYIRSLINDIGNYLGCGAVMSGLVRTKNGILDINNSITLKELEEKVKSNTLNEVLKKDDTFLKDLPKVEVKSESSKIILNGNVLLTKNLITDVNNIKDNEKVRIYLDNKFIGLGEKFEEDDKRIKPIKILYGE